MSMAYVRADEVRVGDGYGAQEDSERITRIEKDANGMLWLVTSWKRGISCAPESLVPIRRKA